MGYSDGNAGKEGPFFALEPVIVLDVVGVRKQWIEAEGGDSV